LAGNSGFQRIFANYFPDPHPREWFSLKVQEKSPLGYISYEQMAAFQKKLVDRRQSKTPDRKNPLPTAFSDDKKEFALTMQASHFQPDQLRFADTGRIENLEYCFVPQPEGGCWKGLSEKFINFGN